MKGFKIADLDESERVGSLNTETLEKGYVYLHLHHDVGKYKVLECISKYGYEAHLLQTFNHKIVCAGAAAPLVNRDPHINMRFRKRYGSLIIDVSSNMKSPSARQLKNQLGLLDAGLELVGFQTGEVALCTSKPDNGYMLISFLPNGRVVANGGVKRLNGIYNRNNEMIIK